MAMSLNDRFHSFAKWTSRITGRPLTFLLAGVIVAGWALTGPIFHYSDTWQLVINTATTIVTFLMVFLIQNTQNRDSQAVHLKLDELIRVMRGAHNTLIDLEDATDSELSRMRDQYSELAAEARKSAPGKKAESRPPKVADQP